MENPFLDQIEDFDPDDFDLDDEPTQQEESRPMVAELPKRRDLLKAATSTIDRWAILGNGLFKATSQSMLNLPAGVYGAMIDPNGNLVFVNREVISDELIELPDAGGSEVLAGIRKFWTRKEAFRSRKQIFKRGILLYGPPGGGKTSVIALLVKDLITAGGLVLYVDNPNIAVIALTQLRKIEPERSVICILEDIDEMVRRFGEHELLQLLDGETQVDNIVFLATTNYPEELAKRIINRPSRFDVVKKIDNPTAESRRMYLQHRAPELTPEQLTQWVADTEGLAVAHLRELIVCVFCLDGDYNETINRLKGMNKFLSSADDKRKIGINQR